MPKVIAVEKGQNLDPAQAVFVFESNAIQPIRWWAGYAWESLDLSIDVFTGEYDRFRPYELPLPQDWEEGRVVVVNGRPSFKYGQSPRRDGDFR